MTGGNCAAGKNVHEPAEADSIFKYEVIVQEKIKINGNSTKLCYHLPIVVYRLRRFLADGGVYRANLQPVSGVGARAPSSNQTRVHSAVDPVKAKQKKKIIRKSFTSHFVKTKCCVNICKIEVELGEYQMDAKQSSADSGTLHKRLVKEKERKKT